MGAGASAHKEASDWLSSAKCVCMRNAQASTLTLCWVTLIQACQYRSFCSWVMRRHANMYALGPAFPTGPPQ